MPSTMQSVLVNSPALYQACAALAAKIWRAHYIPLIGAEQVQYMLETVQSAAAIEQSIVDGCQYFLLRDNADIDIGYCAYEQRDDHCFLSKLYLDADQRGSGYGAAALALVEEATRACGNQRICLTVNKDNLASIAWYERRGFQRIDDICIDIGNGYVMDDYLLEKQV